MKIVDVNVLFYVVNIISEYYKLLLCWFDGVLLGVDCVGFVWVLLLVFV